MERLLNMLVASKALKKFAGVIAVVVIIIILGRQFGMLMPAIILGLVILAAMMLYEGIVWWMGRKKSSAFAKGLSKDMSAPAGGKISARKAQDEMAKRWKEASVQLKKAGMDLYTLPWYMLIGEPQSGKSTTLKFSGLEFPVGTEALSGAGGTRNCDWWFTNEAVVLDTAGRFTFQEQNAPDESEWKKFLGLLRKNRSRCPINGIILVIPCSSLLGDTDEEREVKAMNIREKLIELQREFGVQFPVFLLITKSDQIMGFTEFASRLPAADQRRQIFGWSTPGKFIQAFDPDAFGKAFDAVYNRVHQLRLKILGEDIGLNEIDKIYVFPEEFKAIRDPLHRYLKTIFVKTHYLPPLFFRGFYFTSGLQEGTPIAKAVAAMLKRTGAKAEDIVESLSGAASSKAFFIGDFYTEKLFREQDLVIHSEKRMGMQKKVAWGAIAASALVLLLTVGFIWHQSATTLGNMAKIEESRTDIQTAFDERAARLKLDPGSRMSEADWGTQLAQSGQFWDAIQGLDLDRDDNLYRVLRDMFWMHFIQNVYYPQGQALAERGAQVQTAYSQATEEERRQIDEYVAMWSANQEWMRRTERQENGPFDQADSIPIPGLILASGGDAEGFAAGVKNLKLVLGEDLRFADDPLAGNAFPPIFLPLAPGQSEPGTNRVIQAQLDLEKARIGVPPDAAIDAIVRASSVSANLLQEQFEFLIDDSCGYAADPSNPFQAAAGANPFSRALTAGGRIRPVLAELDELLAEHLEGLGALNLDRAGIEEALKNLPWRAQATGRSAADLERYLEVKAEEIHAEKQGQTESAKNRLANAGTLIEESGTGWSLNPSAAELLRGIEHLENLARAQNEAIQDIATMNLAEPGAVGPSDEMRQEVVRDWERNRERTAALQWAEDRLAGEPAADRDDLGVRELAERLRAHGVTGLEAVRIEAWLRYAQLNLPDPSLRGQGLTETQIEEASFDVRSVPDPATVEWLKAIDEKMAGVKSRMEADPNLAGLTCERCGQRLAGGLERIDAEREKMKADYVRYWMTAFESWEPSRPLEEAQTWPQYLQTFQSEWRDVAFEAFRNLEELVERLSEFEDEIAGASLGDYERDYNDLYDYYDRYDNEDEIADQFEGFNRTLEGLTDGQLEAWRRLRLDEEDPRTGARPRQAFEEFERSFPGKLRDKMAFFPDRAEELIDEAVERAFAEELAQRLGPWRGEMQGKFPFALGAGRPQPPAQMGSQTVTIGQVETARLRRFLLQGDEALIPFLEEYEGILALEEWSARYEGPDRFVRRIRDLREFLFDEDGQYREHRIALAFTGYGNIDRRAPQGDLAGWIFDTIDLQGLLIDGGAGLGSPTPFPRFGKDSRPGSPGNPATVRWTPGNMGSGERLRAIIDRQGSGIESPYRIELAVPGEFGPLAYVYAIATDQIDSSVARVRNVGFDFRVMQDVGSVNNSGILKAIFDFEFDRPLPRPADWADVGGIMNPR